MACFAAAVVEAAVVTIASKVMKSKEEKTQLETGVKTEKLSFSRKLKWLSNMLWGGSALLAFEHIWHGEIVPFAPFLTAAEDPAAFMEMLREVATTGVAMTALVTAVWLGVVAVASAMEKKALPQETVEE